MLPHLEQMSQELGDSVKLVKFNCSKENKDLGKSLGIRVAPPSTCTASPKRYVR